MWRVKMSKEYERQLRVLQHIVDEGEKYDHQFSFRAFDEAMDTGWTRR
jgi:hypothetical protein